MKLPVEHVAQLAYLELKPDEIKRFEDQFESILEEVERLQEVSMSQAEADEMGRFHVTTAFYEQLSLSPASSLRNEEDQNSFEKLLLSNQEAVQNAPATGGLPGELLYEVPSILEK